MDTTQLCTFFVRTSEDQEVKVTLDPLVFKDVGAPLLVIGDWRVLPGQPSIHRQPGEFVCQCLQTSSRAPCHSCFGGSTGEGHFLVSNFTASHSVPGAAASTAALGPVPDELAESAPYGGADALDLPEASEIPEVPGPVEYGGSSPVPLVLVPRAVVLLLALALPTVRQVAPSPLPSPTPFPLPLVTSLFHS